MARVLSIGYDRLLMAIRTMVLQRAGYRVNQANSTRDARGLFGLWKFDVVLICHTVPEPEQVELINEFRLTRPRLPILRITANNHYSDHENCSALDSVAPALLTDISAALRRTGAARAL